MDDKQRLIFRTKAIEYYLKERETLLSPQSIRGYKLKYLWVLLAILVASSAILVSLPVPVYLRGSAVIIDRATQSQAHPELTVVVFLPVESQPSLRVGQRLLLHLSAETKVERSIATVEPEVMSPREAQAKFSLSFGEAQTVNQPVAVVWTGLPAGPATLHQDRSAFVGRVFPVDVEIGTRWAGAFIPGVAQGVIDE